MKRIVRWVRLYGIPVGIVILLYFFNARLGNKTIVPSGSCRSCNVIVISIGPLRAQSLPCYGYPKDSAPNLCGVGRQSIVFTHAYATASKTLDASFSLLTSLYPDVHQMTVPFVSELDPRIETLPQIMHEHGYVTYFLGPVGDPHIPLSMGFGRGFDAVYDANDPGAWTKSLHEILQTHPGSSGPFFAYLHSYAVHEPYVPSVDDVRKFYSGPIPVTISAAALCQFTFDKLHEIHPERFATITETGDACTDLAAYQKLYSGAKTDFDESYAITNTAYWHMFDALPPQTKQQYVHALYLASLYAFDRNFKLFWDDMNSSKLLDHTMVVITGDHGDEFFEHRAYSHGDTVYNEVIHVPLMMYLPNVKGRRIDTLVSTVDIMPTILAVIGIRPPQSISGINILSVRLHTMVLAEHIPDGLLSLITLPYKLIITHARGNERHELYNLTKDPGEHDDLNSALPAVGYVLQRIYFKLQARFPSYSSLQRPLPAWLNTEERQRLIRTGYF